MPNTDIEKLEQSIKSTVLRPLADKFQELTRQIDSGEYELPKTIIESESITENYINQAWVRLETIIQQKIIESQDRSRAEAYEDIRSTMLYHFAYSGRKTIRSNDINKIAPSAIDPISNEIYPNFRTQP